MVAPLRQEEDMGLVSTGAEPSSACPPLPPGQAAGMDRESSPGVKMTARLAGGSVEDEGLEEKGQGERDKKILVTIHI